MTSSFRSGITYRLPQDTNEALISLANVLDIPTRLVRGGGGPTLEALCGTILYRHLNAHERHQAMRSVRSLPSRELQGVLLARILDVTYVNPRWGVWSLTTEESENAILGHEKFQRMSSILGANPGAYGAGAVAWDMWKRRAVTSGNLWVMVACLVLIGVHEYSNADLARLREEQYRRLSPANPNARY